MAVWGRRKLWRKFRFRYDFFMSALVCFVCEKLIAAGVSTYRESRESRDVATVVGPRPRFRQVLLFSPAEDDENSEES